MTEDDYCRVFADALAADSAFRHWILVQTKFAPRRHSTLLLDEQNVRIAKAWWRHWFTKLPDGTESETDVFAVFCDPTDGHRFALHIECKTKSGKFEPRQPEQYAIRAEFMKRNKWVAYEDFDTVLLAPEAFALKFPGGAGAFGAFVSFEQTGRWLPEFME